MSAGSAKATLPSSGPSPFTESILASTVDLPNRFYRYPAARALLPLLGRIPWLTPNHVTYVHMAIGTVAAAIVGFTSGRAWLIVAFVLLEVRMILDCFDGVLARARGTSSTFGRALDEIADTVAFLMLTWAIAHRLHLGAFGVILACAILAFGGLCANAWDFYKRKITGALRDGKDNVFEELRKNKALIDSGNGTPLSYWGVYFDCFQILLYEVRPKHVDTVTLIRTRAGEPRLRRFAGFLALLSFDNGLSIMNLGVLTGLFYESELLVLGYTVLMWISTMISARFVLRGSSAAEAT